MRRFFAPGIAGLAVRAVIEPVHALLANGDFETGADQFVSWPGYVGFGSNPPEVPGWGGMGGRGINPVFPGGPDDAPFRDNGNNSTHVAFLQGTAALQQNVA